MKKNRRKERFGHKRALSRIARMPDRILMKMKKSRIMISIVMFCVMLVSALPFPAAAAETDNVRYIYSFLITELGVNRAAACGILANIEAESNFDPTSGWIDINGYESFGICQWNGSRNRALRQYCSENGYDAESLLGQLEYLKTELTGAEKYAFGKIRDVPDTAYGAYLAGCNWAQYFERCAHYFRGVDQYAERGVRAQNFYWPHYSDLTVSSPVAAAGDVNRDGYVGADDARFVLRCSVGAESLKKESAAYRAADVNRDSFVGADDARLILRASISLETL
ncbi:MAG: hypothetical protein IJK02_06500 [Clostridia bacterium]|nr:hypothetical protein [Clostridia bacterium]MBR0510589.1 hypothetical protein [Clostridia bacterium]